MVISASALKINFAEIKFLELPLTLLLNGVTFKTFSPSLLIEDSTKLKSFFASQIKLKYLEKLFETNKLSPQTKGAEESHEGFVPSEAYKTSEKPPLILGI